MSWLRRLRERLRAWFARLLAEHAAPGRLFAAVVVGAAIGSTPLFGLHFPLCIGAAWLLRLNKVTVYAAANISIPPLVPLLGYASVQTGEWLLHHQLVDLAPADIARAPLAMASRFFLDWLVGGLLVGSAIGVLLGGLVFAVARARAAAGDLVQSAIRAASRRYRAAPRRLRMYALFKYRLDPCYREIARLVDDGTLTVDLGSGLGMLPLVLALLPGTRRAIGVDWDEAKLAAGRAAASGLDRVELVAGDARDFAIPPCDVITLVDVLHYYPAEAQRELLSRCAAALRPGGLLLVREGDATAQRGARWTRWIEAAAVKIGWNRGAGATRFRAASDLHRDLAALGLQVEVAAVAGRLHPGNVLLRARQPAAPIASLPVAAAAP